MIYIDVINTIDLWTEQSDNHIDLKTVVFHLTLLK